jgi:recombination protein RecR
MSAAIPRPVERLIEAFSRLPGIGPKTASRLTYFLLRAVFCTRCFNITVDDPCGVCSDSARDPKFLCVVEEPLDVLAIERTGLFQGHYHVLHGAINPVEGIGPEDLRISELVERVGREGTRELILAMNPTLEGEATSMYLKRQLEGVPVQLTRLARGLPSGGDLEYADVTTLSQAFQGRSEF